jgi:hypothetical protein
MVPFSWSENGTTQVEARLKKVMDGGTSSIPGKFAHCHGEPLIYFKKFPCVHKLTRCG